MCYVIYFLNYAGFATELLVASHGNLFILIHNYTSDNETLSIILIIGPRFYFWSKILEIQVCVKNLR